ncbi:MAG TPA: aldehyde dehydrogenase family protein [Vicinamibacterales bacterium]
MDVFDKFTGERLDSVPGASPADVDRAVRAAAAAWPLWAEMPAHKRSAVLRRTAALIDRDRDEIATLICREAGKAWKFSTVEVARGIETFDFAADEARRLHGETVPLDASAAGEGRVGFYFRTPMGVVAAITPFNFPLNLVAHKVAPALAAGNAVVLKPADKTPLTAVRLAELLTEAGLPEGVFQVIHGDGPRVGEALVKHPLPAKVSFTGSPKVGERILSIAGLKRTTLELGNNSGVMIEPDADLDAAIPRCVMSAFANSGQVCLSLQRVFVHRAIAGTFIDRFVAETAALKIGNPLDRDCDVGPMISEEAAQRVEAWVQEAVKDGATVRIGGRREGRMFWPTVLTDVKPQMRVMCEEVFGPVVSIATYDTFEEGLHALGDTPYGLQAGIYTRDLDKAFAAIRRLDMGGVMVNDTPIFRVDHMPYGGNRMSGIGREGVRYAVEEMSNLRMVVIRPSSSHPG